MTEREKAIAEYQFDCILIGLPHEIIEAAVVGFGVGWDKAAAEVLSGLV